MGRGHGDELIGEHYWFASSDEEELAPLQMAGFEEGAKLERVEVEAQKFAVGSVQVLQAAEC